MFIYRNYTIEHLFPKNYVFSGYGDVSNPSVQFNTKVIFYQLNPASTPHEKIVEIDEIKNKINFILNSSIGSRVIILSLLKEFNNDWQIGKPDLLVEIDRFNIDFLMDISTRFKNVKIFDLNSFTNTLTIPLVDWKFFFTSQLIINPKLAKPFEGWFEKNLRAINLNRKKCLILDCDNTLWGGVVGEDGTHGIKIGLDYPGICFKNFQKLILELSQKG